MANTKVEQRVTLQEAPRYELQARIDGTTRRRVMSRGGGERGLFMEGCSHEASEVSRLAMEQLATCEVRMHAKLHAVPLEQLVLGDFCLSRAAAGRRSTYEVPTLRLG
ncbi:hypothetical protein J1614_000124 [Plenodomus biglobosus]|nr:hypothetical protein J1614_000124 [Plenodomus biglobosus]